MVRCPACLLPLPKRGFQPLAEHLIARAGESDPDHVRWLNQNLSRSRIASEELVRRLEQYFDLGERSLGDWITRRFIAKFFGEVPHPFVLALQHPSRGTLLGYVLEHQHFLRQWVRSCAYIMARTDEPEVVRYELENLLVEFGTKDPAATAHYELLLRMGESLGVSRAEILATPPLPATRRAIAEWNRIATETDWVEAMAALHALELIAHRDLVREGATVHYFDPSILEGDTITPASRAFLREGYEADLEHASEALGLIERFARASGREEEVQATFLRSLDLFDDYLIARLERGEQFEA